MKPVQIVELSRERTFSLVTAQKAAAGLSWRLVAASHPLPHVVYHYHVVAGQAGAVGGDI